MKKEVVVSRESFDKSAYRTFSIVAIVDSEKTRLAVMGIKDFKKYSIIFKHEYETTDLRNMWDPLNLALKEAKEEYDIEIGKCCIGAAGPVSRHRYHIRLTNHDFEIRVDDIQSKTLLKRVILANDFEAIGYGIDLLDLSKDTIRIPHVGEDMTDVSNPYNSIAVIGASRGLGMTIAPYENNRNLHAPIPSEGGHNDFSPYNQKELELVAYVKEKVMERKNVQPELERFISYDGISTIYDFLTFKEKSENLTYDMSKTEKVRILESKYETDKLAKKAIDTFISFYARAARSLALTSECYSGLFIIRRMQTLSNKHFLSKEFMEMFEQHDQRTDVLRKIPVYIVTNQDVGLYGCCNIITNFYQL